MTASTAPSATTAPKPAWRIQAVRVLLVLAGSMVMAIASQASIILQPAPITAQTLALFVIAGLAGPRLTLEILLVWLAEAAVGWPVLAGAMGGVAALTGKTAGFLAGMLIVGPLVAMLSKTPRGSTWLGLLGLFLAGHAAILALGWAWLALKIHPGPAFSGGVAPFLPGALVKTLAAALIVWLSRRTLKSVRP